MDFKKKLGTNLIQDKYTIRFDAYTRNFFRLKAGAVSTEAVWDDEARFFFGCMGFGVGGCCCCRVRKQCSMRGGRHPLSGDVDIHVW